MRELEGSGFEFFYGLFLKDYMIFVEEKVEFGVRFFWILLFVVIVFVLVFVIVGVLVWSVVFVGIWVVYIVGLVISVVLLLLDIILFV